jgi:dihydroorotase-like cyclic amidohydrolase
MSGVRLRCAVMAGYNLVLRNGRVVDPESGFDEVCDVGITGRRIAAISSDALDGDTVVEVRGLVVAPGFIDLHSHAQTLAGRRLHACDGVTTVLDLEAGRAPVSAAYERDEQLGSPVHYGFSVSWAAARMEVLAGVPSDGGLGLILENLADPAWQRAASAREVAAILERLTDGIGDGAIGIGLLMGYAPGVDPAEYTAVARLATTAGVPTFTHSRDLAEITPAVPIDGAEEVVRAASETGAHMHYCHINSTSTRHLDRVHRLVEHCRAHGATVTTEAYPYGSGSTAIGAAFLSPERLAARGLDASTLTYLPTGERVRDDTRLLELRATDPGGLVIFDFMDDDDPADHAILRRALQFDGAIVASDGMPPVWKDAVDDPLRWPLPPAAVTHPRTAGCFSRALRLWREEGSALTAAIRRCTLLPAQVLEKCVPAMRSKGRLRAGADADVVVFDHDRISDQASYQDSTRPSTGIIHVLVDGTFVVRDENLVLDARPGRALRGSPA